MIVRILLLSVPVLVVLLTPVRDAQAVEPLSIGELALHCEHYSEDPDSKDGIFYMRYIQGFIDGAVATDERVLLNVEAEYGRKETYAEKAARVRYGRRTLRDRAARYAEFCLGEPIPLKEVVEKVVGHLEGRELTDNLLPSLGVVYSVLRKEYPCEKDDDK